MTGLEPMRKPVVTSIGGAVRREGVGGGGVSTSMGDAARWWSGRGLRPGVGGGSVREEAVGSGWRGGPATEGAPTLVLRRTGGGPPRPEADGGAAPMEKRTDPTGGVGTKASGGGAAKADSASVGAAGREVA